VRLHEVRTLYSDVWAASGAALTPSSGMAKKVLRELAKHPDQILQIP
jgi:hypothetical protein